LRAAKKLGGAPEKRGPILLARLGILFAVAFQVNLRKAGASHAAMTIAVE
jgi:hypothetical protein